MENYVIPREVYEVAKQQILKEIEEKKIENRRINLAAEAVFAKARKNCLEQIALKKGARRNEDGSVQINGDAWDIFLGATKLALTIVGERSSRSAYMNGNGEIANHLAEKICESILT